MQSKSSGRIYSDVRQLINLPLIKSIRWKKKWSRFDLKSWVTGGTKIRTGIPSKWRIFESNWLHIESQIVNLTLNVESIWLKYSPITRNSSSNSSSASDSTI